MFKLSLLISTPSWCNLTSTILQRMYQGHSANAIMVAIAATKRWCHDESDAVIITPKYRSTQWYISWYGPKHVFLHLYKAENTSMFISKTFTTWPMLCNAVLFLHYEQDFFFKKNYLFVNCISPKICTKQHFKVDMNFRVDD